MLCVSPCGGKPAPKMDSLKDLRDLDSSRWNAVRCERKAFQAGVSFLRVWERRLVAGSAPVYRYAGGTFRQAAKRLISVALRCPLIHAWSSASSSRLAPWHRASSCVLFRQGMTRCGFVPGRKISGRKAKGSSYSFIREFICRPLRRAGLPKGPADRPPSPHSPPLRWPVPVIGTPDYRRW